MHGLAIRSERDSDHEGISSRHGRFSWHPVANPIAEDVVQLESDKGAVFHASTGTTSRLRLSHSETRNPAYSWTSAVVRIRLRI